jgi:hypothetical protein
MTKLEQVKPPISGSTDVTLVAPLLAADPNTTLVVSINIAAKGVEIPFTKVMVGHERLSICSRIGAGVMKMLNVFWDSK